MPMFRNVANRASLLPGAPWLSEDPDLQTHFICRLIQDSSLFSQISWCSIIGISVHPPVYWSVLPYRKPNLPQKCKKKWSKTLASVCHPTQHLSPFLLWTTPISGILICYSTFLIRKKRNCCRYQLIKPSTLLLNHNLFWQAKLAIKSQNYDVTCPQECAGDSKG